MCTLCPDGSFYNSSVLRSDSKSSSFLQDRCRPCEAGTSSFHPNACHALVAVDQQCSSCSCPPRVSSLRGNSICSYCNEDYILNSTFKGGLLELSPTSNKSSSFAFYSNLCGAESTFDVNVSSINLNDSWNKSFFTYFNCEEFIFETSQSNEMSCLSCLSYRRRGAYLQYYIGNLGCASNVLARLSAEEYFRFLFMSR